MIVWFNFGDLMEFLHQLMPCDWFFHYHGFYYCIKICWLIIPLYC